MEARTQVVRAMSAALPHALFALDFDGTLAPLVDDPDESRLTPAARAALEALAARGARVALVTGRDAATAVRLSALAELPGLVVVGLYGAERWQAGQLSRFARPEVLDGARVELPALLPAGVWLEDKGLSLVVHARTAPDPSAALASVTAPLRRLAARFGLEVHPGRDVCELRLPGFDKGRALRDLVREIAPQAVLYAGDDLGDLPAFAAIKTAEVPGGAWSVAAGDPVLPGVAAAADLVLSGPDGVADLLREIAEG
jgi:trehalose 6-phosphate phosphatase